jgi:hypothetical protein
MPNASEVVVLRGGVSVTLPALRLAWDLENRGCTLNLDSDESLLVRPRGLLTDEDRRDIQTWREDLKRIIRYCEAGAPVA